MSRLDPELCTLVRGSIRSAVRSGGDLSATLDQLGWREVVDEDPAFANEVLFGELGAAGTATALYDQVVLDALGVETVVTVIYPRPGSVSCGRLGATLTGLSLRDVSVGSTVAVPVETEGDIRVAVGPVAVGTCTPLAAWQRDNGAHLVELEVLTTASLLDGSWIAARAAVRRCLAHEVLGVDERILELTADHVRTREQFGHALGSFQAVRHRVAEMYVQITAGRQLAHDAWLASEDDADRLALVAKAYAARAHRIVAAHAMQVCGAIGLTWEHPLTGLVRRGFFLNALLGDERGLGGELGAGVADPAEPMAAVLAPELLLAEAG